MDGIITAARFAHIAAGFLGLALYWVPVFARKGGVNHVRFGRWFEIAAYFVLGTAAVTTVTRLVGTAMLGIGPTDAPMRFTFIVFLGYLTWVTFVIVRHGVGVLRTKKDPTVYRSRGNLALAYSSMVASLLIITYALYYQPGSMIVLLALSPIGILSGWGMRRYIVDPPESPKAWFYEHMGSMLGAGIAFHTAFAVFGATRLFDIGLTGWISVVPWVLPTVIGIPASEIWTRYYRRKFGDLPPPAEATA
jgi:hypothetical protein